MTEEEVVGNYGRVFNMFLVDTDGKEYPMEEGKGFYTMAEGYYTAYRKVGSYSNGEPILRDKSIHKDNLGEKNGKYYALEAVFCGEIREISTPTAYVPKRDEFGNPIAKSSKSSSTKEAAATLEGVLDTLGEGNFDENF